MTDSEIITATKRRLKLYTDDTELDSELQSMLNGCRSDLELSGVKFPEAQNNPLFLEVFIILNLSWLSSILLISFLSVNLVNRSRRILDENIKQEDDKTSYYW